MGRHPVVIGLLGVVLLGSLTVPVKDLHLALPTDSTSSTETSAGRAADLIDGAFGPGRNAPLLLVVDARATGGGRAAGRGHRHGDRMGGRPARRRERPGRRTERGRHGRAGADHPEQRRRRHRTEQLLTALRDGQPAQEQATGTTLVSPA